MRRRSAAQYDAPAAAEKGQGCNPCQVSKGTGEKRVHCVHFAEGESDSQVGGFTSWEHGSVANADETEWMKSFGGFGQSPKCLSHKSSVSERTAAKRL